MAELAHIEGLDKLAWRLKQLPDRIGRNVLRGAVSAGAAVIRNEAKLKAPLYTGDVSKGHPPPGTLKRSIYQKQIAELSSLGRQVFYVGVRQGKEYQKQGKKGNLSQDAYYWKFVEFGTVNMAAHPFLRPAFEVKKMDAVSAISDYMEARIPQEVSKL